MYHSLIGLEKYSDVIQVTKWFKDEPMQNMPKVNAKYAYKKTIPSYYFIENWN